MNDLYQIRIQGDRAVLFTGTMYECERWVHYNGQIDVAYEISKKKERKRKCLSSL